ncbi:flagellar basal-body MS-ring/collar protein FliF [Helicobacter ailurogastricus]|uniref:flagellar basal-body MS-ring/collar protein FliF n=1 Tax=Helicobacter ailurogastricus TaxID=1578720 RepID=UPI0022CBCD97|nr:flagellar basal-body MS-ring/collar protein FliF [Helicobacter ailurogastricus]GLH57712.1 Flagellar M-ring protein FliF [Helicobacter ailurogastricus]GLH58879.1 Flagellar M-ring protein FliF [Helicobacter ailurogastricus]GMB90903.1 Flagellar M-ring protein FliF [Helicobacter ailurogastricus]
MDFKGLLQQIISLFSRLNKAQKITIVVAVSLIVAFLVFLLLYPTKDRGDLSGYGVLFEGMDASDNALILQHLQQKHIPYKIPKDDTILIPKDKVYEERISLASQGIPKTSKVGYEIFDVKDFGATDFDQNIKYIRAIEGELSRTIESLVPIEKADVHIAIPKDSVFVSREIPPTASVMLKIKPNMRLLPKQILGIKNLIAASVPKLTVENVKLVNENGEPLGEDDELDTTRELAQAQLHYKQNFENILENKIANILAPIVGGHDKVVAKVSAEFDFSQKKSTKETFDPNNVVRSEQTMEEKKEGFPKKQVGGVPGVVSNIGPVQGINNDQMREKYEKSTNTTNYEVGKTVSEIKGEFGVLTRLNAAVVVDGKYKKVDKNGTEGIEYIALSADEMEKINSLVKQAIGYNKARGDAVTVSNFEFNGKSAKYVPMTTYEKVVATTEKILGPFSSLLKYLIVGLVLFVFYKRVITPFSQRMLEIHPDEEEKVQSLFAMDEDDEEEIDRFGEMRKKVEDQLGLNANFNEEDVKYDIMLERVSNSIKERPEEIASLFRLLIKDEVAITNTKGN